MINRPRNLLCAVAFFCVNILPVIGCSTSYTDRPQVQQFIAYMVQQHHLNQQELQQLFRNIKPNQAVLNAIKKGKKPVAWRDYQSFFVTETRVRQGVVFWKKHAAILTYAQQHYGVPAEIIVAIIGIESNYGQNTGKFRVLDSLATLSFDYPPRATYFKSELEQFLLLNRKVPVVDISMLGSFAGAIGQPQFMPSSYLRFAVDAHQKGYSDLINNTDDAILSVANYLKHCGWVRGEPVAVLAYINQPTIIDQKPHSLQQLIAAHIYPTSPVPPHLQATLIPLQGKLGPEYWLSFANFQVIKRYNNDPLYALAVYQTSKLIRADYQHNTNQKDYALIKYA